MAKRDKKSFIRIYNYGSRDPNKTVKLCEYCTHRLQVLCFNHCRSRPEKVKGTCGCDLYTARYLPKNKS